MLTAHVLISLTAVLLALETNIVLHQPFQPYNVYLLIGAATFFAYNVYYIKTERAVFYRILSSVAFLTCVLLIFFLPAYMGPRFLIIGLASAIYIFPLFFSFKKDKSFTFQKLLLLVFIWSATTFVLPLQTLQYDFDTLILLVYRIVFISSSCLLFFIRDEKNPVYRSQAVLANVVCAVLQIVLALFILLFVQTVVGIVFLIVSVLGLLLVKRFLQREYPAIYYLAFADGILFLQALILVILYQLQLV